MARPSVLRPEEGGGTDFERTEDVEDVDEMRVHRRRVGAQADAPLAETRDEIGQIGESIEARLHRAGIISRYQRRTLVDVVDVFVVLVRGELLGIDDVVVRQALTHERRASKSLAN